jgi:hypothetical protein
MAQSEPEGEVFLGESGRAFGKPLVGGQIVHPAFPTLSGGNILTVSKAPKVKALICGQ